MLRAGDKYQMPPSHDYLDTHHPSTAQDPLLKIRIPISNNDTPRRGSVQTQTQTQTRAQPHAQDNRPGGLANLNRWSQSTASPLESPVGPATAIKHDHGFQTGSIWARRSVAPIHSPEDVSPRTQAQLRSDHDTYQSPEYDHRRRAPRMNMSMSQSSNESDAFLNASIFTPTGADLLTPASYSNPDYFGNLGWGNDNPSHAMPPRTSSRATSAMSRHQDHPGPGLGPAPGLGRTRSARKDKDKKTMLSKALEKANTAVLLDNALNYEGALEAYQDACRLLEHVMERTSSFDDHRKLDAIRDTYNVRIEELLQIQATSQTSRQDKKLPPRPMSDDSMQSHFRPSTGDSAMIENAIMTRIVDAPPLASASPSTGARTSFLTSAIQEVEGTSARGAFLGPLWERSRSPYGESIVSDRTARPYEDLDTAYMPRPLTPRRQEHVSDDEGPYDLDLDHAYVDPSENHKSSDAVSWLDTIDESGSIGSASASNQTHSTRSRSRSRSSSIRSRSSHHDHQRNTSVPLHHESLDFDAAFDAAVEAAYEDGYEIDHGYHPSDAERLEPNFAHSVPIDKDQFHMLGDSQFDDDEAEEERILDDLTNDYIDHGFNFDIQSKSALPRQSDSSTSSNRTWQSSHISNRTTAGTSLSTVAENVAREMPKNRPMHTPSSSLATDASKTSTESAAGTGAQENTTPNRRNAGPNFKQLKIETSAKKPTGLRSRGYTNTEPAKTIEEDETNSDVDKRISEVPSLRHVEAALASPYHRSSTMDSSLDANTMLDSARSPRPRLFRGKQRSLASLRDHIPEETETGQTSPLSAYPTLGDAPLTSRRYMSSIGGGSISISRTDSVSGGFHILEDFLSPPNQPPSPGEDDSCSPSSLEPCPESILLRPFWLLRCVASTINQPRGGFLTTRIFVPRQVWQNRGVKLKNVEEKIANCDLLTASLGRLAKVDTYDADAVLEELQTFEEVMERVQAVLIKRLGSDVGPQGASALLKDGPSALDGTGMAAENSRESKTNKSYLSSWRKLRGKNSTGGVTIPLSSTREGKDLATMASVPMTSFVPVEKRTAHKHTVTKDASSFEGPHKEYMYSVARLCEAVQVIDQVARQVEDPGLKHSSPTHIGLELTTRHAAEFFGFYICRFILGDLGTLMDKYVKRSTEWILV